MTDSMTEYELVLQVHTDTKGSYFEVEASIVTTFDLTPSEHSFVSPDGAKYFLEADQDAEQLISALSTHGISFSFAEIEHSLPAYFSNYPKARCLH